MISKKIEYYKDPIHNEIIFPQNDSWLLDLINCPEFQRLHKIKQLGYTHNLFPSATHTRFSHSLGTYEIVRKFIENLNQGQITDYERKVVLAAGLLHDIGHGPNSHSFEKYTGISHEEFTYKIILSKTTNINKILVKNKIKPSDIIKVLDKKCSKQWMNNIISSQIDADRIDYLLRDTHYTGASYGKVDLQILIRRCLLVNNDIVFRPKAISEIENMLVGRYHMYKQVYLNNHVLCCEWVVENLLKRLKYLYSSKAKLVNKFNLYQIIEPWLKDEEFSIEQFLYLNDSNFYTLLDSMEFEQDEILKKLFYVYKNPHLIKIDKYEPKLFSSINKQLSKEEQKYLFKVFESIDPLLYNNKKQPIKIYNDKTKKITTADKESFLLKQKNNKPSKNKYLIYIKYN